MSDEPHEPPPAPAPAPVDLLERALVALANSAAAMQDLAQIAVALRQMAARGVVAPRPAFEVGAGDPPRSPGERAPVTPLTRRVLMQQGRRSAAPDPTSTPSPSTDERPADGDEQASSR